jgi:hypothetical protein
VAGNATFGARKPPFAFAYILTSTIGPLLQTVCYRILYVRGKLRMLATAVLGMSVIACRNFCLYYWRAVAAG